MSKNEIEEKKTKLQKALKAKEIAIKRIKAKKLQKQKLDDTINLWKGQCEFLGQKREKREENKKKKSQKPNRISVVHTRYKGRHVASNAVIDH